jgi:hypothetical protein
MKGVCGGENQSKRTELLPEVQIRLFENQELVSFFILHFSFFTACSLPSPISFIFVFSCPDNFITHEARIPSFSQSQPQP